MSFAGYDLSSFTKGEDGDFRNKGSYLSVFSATSISSLILSLFPFPLKVPDQELLGCYGRGRGGRVAVPGPGNTDLSLVRSTNTRLSLVRSTNTCLSLVRSTNTHLSLVRSTNTILSLVRCCPPRPPGCWAPWWRGSCPTFPGT